MTLIKKQFSLLKRIASHIEVVYVSIGEKSFTPKLPSSLSINLGQHQMGIAKYKFHLRKRKTDDVLEFRYKN